VDGLMEMVRPPWGVKPPAEFAYVLIRDGYLKPWEEEEA
jgi:hypothetical protein